MESHSEAVIGPLSLGEIEKILEAQGHTREQIDTALAFIIAARQALAASGKFPWRDPRPQ